MLIVLPPSETKAVGGKNPAIDFDSLHFPTLNPIRKEIAHDLARLDIYQAQEILKLSQKLLPEAQRNIELFQSPTMPAVLRYTGGALRRSRCHLFTQQHMGTSSCRFRTIWCCHGQRQYPPLSTFWHHETAVRRRKCSHFKTSLGQCH